MAAAAGSHGRSWCPGSSGGPDGGLGRPGHGCRWGSGRHRRGAPAWSLLREAGGVGLFHAGSSSLILHRKETPAYLENLSGDQACRLRRPGAGRGSRALAARPAHGLALGGTGLDGERRERRRGGGVALRPSPGDRTLRGVAPCRRTLQEAATDPRISAATSHRSPGPGDGGPETTATAEAKGGVPRPLVEPQTGGGRGRYGRGAPPACIRTRCVYGSTGPGACSGTCAGGGRTPRPAAGREPGGGVGFPPPSCGRTYRKPCNGRHWRRLWRTDPTLACLDGLVDYADDYTDAALARPGLKTVFKVARMLDEAIEATGGTERVPLAATSPTEAAADGPRLGDGWRGCRGGKASLKSFQGTECHQATWHQLGKAKRTLIGPEDQGRACLYRLLARMLAGAPDQVTLDLLQGLGGDGSPVGADMAALAQAAAVAEPKALGARVP